MRGRSPPARQSAAVNLELNGRNGMLRRSVVVTTALALAVLAGMTARAGADVLVTGYADSSVLRFAEDGTPLPPIIPPGGNNGVVGPGGITFGPDGNLYVSNQTSVFAPGVPDFVVQIEPSTGIVTPLIEMVCGYAPAGLRIGPDGQLYGSRN